VFGDTGSAAPPPRTSSRVRASNLPEDSAGRSAMAGEPVKCVRAARLAGRKHTPHRCRHRYQTSLSSSSNAFSRDGRLDRTTRTRRQREERAHLGTRRPSRSRLWGSGRRPCQVGLRTAADRDDQPPPGPPVPRVPTVRHPVRPNGDGQTSNVPRDHPLIAAGIKVLGPTSSLRIGGRRGQRTSSSHRLGSGHGNVPRRSRNLRAGRPGCRRENVFSSMAWVGLSLPSDFGSDRQFGVRW